MVRWTNSNKNLLQKNAVNKVNVVIRMGKKIGDPDPIWKVSDPHFAKKSTTCFYWWHVFSLLISIYNNKNDATA